MLLSTTVDRIASIQSLRVFIRTISDTGSFTCELGAQIMREMPFDLVLGRDWLEMVREATSLDTIDLPGYGLIAIERRIPVAPSQPPWPRQIKADDTSVKRALCSTGMLASSSH